MVTAGEWSQLVIRALYNFCDLDADDWVEYEGPSSQPADPPSPHSPLAEDQPPTKKRKYTPLAMKKPKRQVRKPKRYD